MTQVQSATVLPFRARSKAERRLCRDCLWCGGALADQCEATLVTELKFLSRMPAELARREEEARRQAELIRLHLRFFGYAEGRWSDSAVRRYVRDAGDLLDQLASDSRARSILLYLEAIQAPRKFLSAARAAARSSWAAVPGKAAVKASTGFLFNLAMVASTEQESIPPERNMPNGTSARW